jgi:phenylacetate-CoA ligase
MHAHQEMVIGRVLGAPIRGLYGSGEKIISAAQCAEGRYHLSLVDGYVEGQFGLRPEVRPAAVTTLINRLMPLVRYQVGDEISMAEDQSCPCGRTLPVMSPVITKHEDYVVTPSGRRISPSTVVYAFIHLDIENINKGQVVQEDERRVTVHINAAPEVFDRYHDMLKKSMTDVFFGEMEVTVVRTEEIDVQRSGKSRFIVNKLLDRFHDVSTGAGSG